MADRLRWTMLRAVTGMNGTASDTLMQPDSEGRLTARAMHALDPFDVPGMAVPARGYSRMTASPGGMNIGLGYYDNGSSVIPVGAWKDGDDVGIYALLGTWTRIDVQDMPFSGASYVRFATAYNALFMVDGVHRVRVYGWQYDPEEPSLAWDQTQTWAEIKYTNGQKSEPPSPDDDFIAEGLCFHGSRLVLWRRNMVRMSAAFMPTRFYDEVAVDIQRAWWEVRDGTGSRITWAGSVENRVLAVALATSIHGYVLSDDGLGMSHIVLDASRGVYAPRSAVVASQRLYFCAQEGPHTLDMKDGTQYIGSPIQGIWDRMSASQRRDVVGVWFRNRYGIVLPVSAVPPAEIGTIPVG